MNKSKVVRGFLARGTLKLDSPLIIGDGSNVSDFVDMTVLRDKNDKPYIPGTSLAGVLRHNYKYFTDSKNTLPEIPDEVLTEMTKSLLFGDINGFESPGNQSALRIFDVILEKTKIVYRDGVSIEYGLGVAKDEHKYDLEAIDRDATGNIYIECVIRQGHIDSLRKQLKDYFDEDNDFSYDDEDLRFILTESVKRLVDLLYNGIQVGRFTTKGFGKAKVSDCMLEEFTLDSNKSLLKWITRNTSQVSGDIQHKGKYRESTHNDFRATIMAHIDSTLLVRALGNNPSIDATMLKSKDDFVLPGASIKGVFRHHCRYILEKINKWADWDKVDETGSTSFDKLFGGMIYDTDTVVGFLKSRLFVEEAYIHKNDVKNVIQTRNKIDRFTGGVIDSALFTEEAIYQTDKTDGVVQLQFVVKNCTKKEAGLMLILIRDLWVGKLTFGSNASIGRGRLRGQSASICIGNKYYYMENQIDGQVCREGVISSDDVKDINNYISEVL